MDDYYFEDYRDVDADINTILIKQQAFDKKYNVAIDKEVFTVGDNALVITLLEKEKNTPVPDANITVKITKPDTDKFDKMLKVTGYENGHYRLENFQVEKIGRWQIMTKIITPDQLASFSKTEVNATN